MHRCDAHNVRLPLLPARLPDGAGDGGLPAPLRQGRHSGLR